MTTNSANAKSDRSSEGNEQARDLPRFDHDDAWRTGRALAERCRDQKLPVSVSIWLGEQLVFHRGLPGSSADNDRWAERKARTVRRFGCSSMEIHERYGTMGADFFPFFGVDPLLYSLAGGAVPVRVRGSIVGVIAVSGLEMADDHRLALSALTQPSDCQ